MKTDACAQVAAIVGDDEVMTELRLSLVAKQRQSARHARAVAERDPTVEALLAGVRWGAATTAAGALLVYGLHRTTALRSASPAGKAWLVTASGMAGFFVASEKAVVSGVKVKP